jgi:hypothetical protein
MLKVIGAVAAAAFLWQSAGTAHASTVTYDLSLAGDVSGTGTLTFTDGPVTNVPQFDVDVADITTLTFTIGGLTFNPTATVVDFQSGSLWDITFGWTYDTTHSEELTANGTTAVLFNPSTNGEIDDTITANLQTNLQDVPSTPLPAAFPLFATALAGLGLLGWHRKRMVSAGAKKSSTAIAAT